MVNLLLLIAVAQTNVYLSDPTHPGKTLYRVMSDGGIALNVWDNAASGGSAPGGGLTDTELRATPVPVSGTLACTGPLTDTQLRASAVPVSGTLTCSGPLTDTQLRLTPVPVSGTLTCNAGSNLNTSSLALDATLTGRTQKSQVTDGTRDGTVKAASTAAQAADTSLVVALSPNSPIPAGSAVIGHVIHDTGSTTVVTGNVTVVQATGTNLHVVSDSTSTTACTQATGTNLHVVTDATSVLAANQSVNVSQVNGVTPLMGVGASGTGAQRVAALIHDGTNTAAVKAASTAAAATDPALVVSISPNGGNPCQNPGSTLAAVAGATSGTAAVQLVALSGSTKIYLCSVNITGVSGTSPTFSLKYGTGSACATGGVTILGAWTTAANTVYTFIQPFVTPAGQALCYLDTGTTPIQNYAISYVQQ